RMRRSCSTEIGVMHEKTGASSTSTVHAPHWPRPQPNFAPFSPRSLRSTYSSGVAGSASTSRFWPLTFRVSIVSTLRFRANVPRHALGILPRRLVAERSAHVIGERAELRIGERAAECGHPRPALAVSGLDAVQGDLDEVARRRRG